MQTTPTVPGHHEVGLDAVLERSRKKGKKLKRLSSGPKEAAFQTALKGSYDYNYIQWYEISESVSRSVVSASLGAPPGSTVHGILQARMLEWVAMPFSRGSSQTRDQTQVSCIASRFFII